MDQNNNKTNKFKLKMKKYQKKMIIISEFKAKLIYVTCMISMKTIENF